MPDWLRQFIAADFMPHGHCYAWDRGVVGLHVTSDALIALAYYSIPVTMFWFSKRRKDFPFRRLFQLFALFILACGTTHLLEIYSVWKGAYWLTGSVKGVTAAISLTAAVVLIRQMPYLVQLRSPYELQAVNNELAAEVKERNKAQRELADAHDGLELMVAERTKDLEEANAKLAVEVEQRRLAEERFRLMVEASPIAKIMSDDDGRILMINKQAETLLGYDREELIGKSIETLVPDRARAHHPKLRAGYLHSPSNRSMGPERDLSIMNKAAEEIPVEIALNPIQTENQSMILTTIFNLTERRAAERQVRKSLADKELLLQEIHHRVKNNMQVISSLLELQARTVTDETARRELRENVSRVQTMALIHERLYQSENLGHIDLEDYLERLLAMLVRSQADPKRNRIKIEADLDNGTFSLDVAVPLGLIVNELTTNAFQHAFPDNREGVVKLSFKPCGTDEWVLTISDNGVGISSEQDDASTKLGIQLIQVLTKQINGRLDISSDETGTSTKIIFPSVGNKESS